MDEDDEYRPISRDDIAMAVMMKALDMDWRLFRDPKYLAGQCHRVADAMIAARQEPPHDR